MTEKEALLKAILAFPEDDTARLVYADYIQEHGEEDRAEFIRLQIELSRYTFPTCEQPIDYDDRSGRWWEPNRGRKVKSCGMCDACKWSAKLGQQLKPLLDREWGLLNSVATIVGQSVYLNCHKWAGWPKDALWQATSSTDVAWTRGFVSGFPCHGHNWLIHAHKIIAEHPIETVEILGLPSASNERMCFLAAKYKYDWWPTEVGRGESNAWRFAIEMFAKEWPSITFAPPPSVDLNPQPEPIPIPDPDEEFDEDDGWTEG